MNKLHFDDESYLSAMQRRTNVLNHIHWDGSIPADDLWRFYQDNRKKLFLLEKYIDGTRVEGDREIKSADELRSFQTNLFTKYDIVSVFSIPVGAMQTEEDIKAMAVAHCRYLRSQRTVYAESRFAPWYHTQQGLSIDQVIGYALEGFSQSWEEEGVKVKPIICINREVDSEEAKKIVRAALNFSERGVVGIDLACYEPPFPPEKFKEAYALTFDSPLKRTVHADEMCPEEEGIRNLTTAIDDLRADGISHAIHLWKHPKLIEKMREKEIRLESNPISNLTCSFIRDIAELHLDLLIKQGVKVTINSDDPAMWSNGDLAHNLYAVGKLYGNNFVDMVIRNGVETAWGLAEDEKKQFLENIGM
ncbi:hypothetical protein HY495_04060 [Candidatus Woesearchaeota archaeon]|nr:hypothetical protein [Candidatus Woesearchaeota archaeon]